MNSRVLVLGAGGRLGHKAAEAFRDAGWTVTSLVRPGRASRAPAGTEAVEVDALDHAAVSTAARGADVILHALNPFYTDWSRLALPLAYSAITAAETTGATLMFPGNLYNYGSPMPPVIDETTPMRPSSRKGQMRVAMEDRMAEATERGMRASPEDDRTVAQVALAQVEFADVLVLAGSATDACGGASAAAKFWKNSPASFLAVESISRPPSCASFPPICASTW